MHSSSSSTRQPFDAQCVALSCAAVFLILPRVRLVDQDPSGRIDFQFDEAGFDFKALPFNIPYPVPFRLFGDEVRAIDQVVCPQIHLSSSGFWVKVRATYEWFLNACARKAEI